MSNTNTEEHDEHVNINIKKEIKEEMIENTLEQNIDAVLKTRSLGLAGG